MGKGFNSDLTAGEESEARLMNMVRSLGKTPMKPIGRFPHYDFFVCETKKAYEVKRDWKSAETGNVVVEVEMPIGTPSGLLTSIADWWIFDLPEEFVFIDPKQIRKLILQEDLRSSRFVGDGDVTEKRAYLVKVDLLKKYAESIKGK
jgi:hypothetical protein